MQKTKQKNRLKLIGSFRRQCEGATAVEFALVAIPFFLLFMGIIEYGLYMMTEVALESAVTQAGRSSAISQTTDPHQRAATVEALVRQKALGLINNSELVFSEATVVSGGTTAPDLCFINGLNNPPSTTVASCPPGTPMIDANGVPGYQPSNLSSDAGNSGDLVEIRVSYPWQVQFPVFKQFFGNDGLVMISSTTVIRNE